MPTLIVADDHPLFRSALIHTLSQRLPDCLTYQADSFDATLTCVEQHPEADLLLLDLHMPGSCDFLGLIQLRKSFPALPIAVVTASDDIDIIRRVMAFGAAAYIPKSAAPDAIHAAISSVLMGELWVPDALQEQIFGQQAETQDLDLAARVAQLTPQQYKVLYYVTEGRLNKQIAYDLDISEATVKAHMTAIFRKLDCSNRTQVVIKAQRLMLEPPEV